jgi:transposase
MPARALAEMRRDMARLRLIEEQIAEVEGERLRRLEDTRSEYRPTDAMVRQLARVVGLGIETADMLVHEIFTRDLRDRRAVARYAGLTGSPDESGSRRRERGLSRAGNARVRRGMVQLAWRFLVFQKDSALVRWYRERTADGRGRDAHGDDRGARPQAADRPVADGQDRRDSRRGPAARGGPDGRPITRRACGRD